MKIDPDEYVILKKSDLFQYLGQFLPKGDVDCAPVAASMIEWVDENKMNMWTIPEFQKDMVEKTYRWFPDTVKDGEINLHMLIYGICGESGEIADEMKKFIRGSRTQEELVEKLGNESVDLFHYIALLWVVLGIDPGEVYAKLTEANEKRFGPKEG
jgi:NTP pyrophosphatase (non-canonical NTP hydrolase)